MSDDLGLGGADAPRPLPPAVRARIEAELLARGQDRGAGSDDSVLTGVDGPRPLPPALRARLEATFADRQDPQRRRRAIATVALFVLVAGLAAAVSGGALRPSSANRAVRRAQPPEASSPPPTAPIYAAPTEHVGPSLPAAGHLGLAPFASCDDLLAYFRQHAAEQTSAANPYPFLGGGGGGVMRAPMASGNVSGKVSGAPGMTAQLAGAPSMSTSNVQEPGVDEPDVTKTDGDHLYVVEGQLLDIVDITGDDPVVVASVPVEPGSRLFLSGHDLLALATGYASGTPSTSATTYDVSDPANPIVRGQATLDGELVAARFIDGRAQVVTTRAPSLAYLNPDQSLIDPSTVIADSTIDQWIGDRPCTTVQHPEEFSGFDLTTIYTIDPAAPSSDTSTSLVAGASTVYASATDVYVAEMSWASSHPPAPDANGQTPPEVTTAIHRFGFDGLGAFYVASGTVLGRLLDQFSMSQDGQFLRVATTTGWWSSTGTTSGVSVLETQGALLVTVGQLRGLAPGEAITGARFVGDKAYLVTAVQMHDPLFVIDLGDPTAPRELGHVELPGFSSYVHPLDADHILAVGPDGSNGVAVKLFDVSDPTAPVLAGTVAIADAWSPVQADHLAFLYWPERGLAVVPFWSWTAPMESPTTFSEGAIAVHFDGSSINEEATLVHTDRPGAATSAQGPMAPGMWRSVVVGDRLFTISGSGVLVSDLDTFQDLSWVPLPSS